MSSATTLSVLHPVGCRTVSCVTRVAGTMGRWGPGADEAVGVLRRLATGSLGPPAGARGARRPARRRHGAGRAEPGRLPAVEGLRLPVAAGSVPHEPGRRGGPVGRPAAPAGVRAVQGGGPPGAADVDAPPRAALGGRGGRRGGGLAPRRRRRRRSHLPPRVTTGRARDRPAWGRGAAGAARSRGGTTPPSGEASSSPAWSSRARAAAGRPGPSGRTGGTRAARRPSWRASTTHAPRARAAATAPPLPIIIVRSSVSPRAGTRGPARAGPGPPPPDRDVHRDDRPLVALGEQVDGQVVEDAAVDEQPPVVGGIGAKSTGSRTDAERRVDEVAAPVHLAGAADQVGAHQRAAGGAAPR